MKFADGSNSSMLSPTPACIRAIDSYIQLARAADRLSETLDAETVPGLFHTLDDDDSLILAIRSVPASGKKPQIGG